MSPFGVDFWLRRHGLTTPPAGFDLVRRAAPPGTSPTRRSTAATLDLPFFPIVFPIGDDDEGTWLVPLGPGDVPALLGEPAAPDLGGPPGGR